MKVIVDLCIIPIGVGISLSSYVAACEKILLDAGLKTQLHANGTNIEGEWDEVFDAIRRCHETLHEMGVPRIAATIRVGTRTDRHQTMEDKIQSVQVKLSKSQMSKTSGNR
ncbi:MAG: MTH1187 family thiamine-binding protein [Anaerolineales bacterium]|nr:MTH1187 family thiamine-binding protein [Anaerolineales bacterium]